MLTEARSVQRAERLILKKPDWVDFLPEDRTNMAMRYISNPSNPDMYFVVISKPGQITEDIETIEEITVSKDDIKAARDWLDQAHYHIDQHDDERRTLEHSSMQTLVVGVNTIISRISPVFAFADKSFEEEKQRIKQFEA